MPGNILNYSSVSSEDGLGVDYLVLLEHFLKLQI